jgi:hypothetical protein
VALLGWLIEGVHSDVALRTLYPVAAAAAEAAELSVATVVLAAVVSKVMAVSWGMAMSKAKAMSKATVELKVAAATSVVATAICKGKSASVLVGRSLGASFDCCRGP